jgi:predicted lipoprotein
MRIALLAAGLVLVAACGAREEPATDSTAMAMAPTIALSYVAGVWTMRVMPEIGYSTVLTAEMNLSADPAGSTITFQGRPPIPMTVRADGDSVITDAGPYDSALRANQKVTTHGVFRLVNGELHGMTTAHYQTTGADSVARFRTVATKKM